MAFRGSECCSCAFMNFSFLYRHKESGKAENLTDRSLFGCWFQSSASSPEVIGWVFGWNHGGHADVPSGHGAGQDGCDAQGDVSLLVEVTTLTPADMKIFVLFLRTT